MLSETIKLSIFILLLGLVGYSFVAFNIYYRKYYKYMKQFHQDKWWELMSKDPMVENAGEWIRWPLGSVYLINSVFKLREDYNDEQVLIYKKRVVSFFASFIVAFILLLITAALLPK